MNITNRSSVSLAETLGARLKQARLNCNLSQEEVAEIAGISRKSVLNSEQGKGRLEVFVAIMTALNLTDQLNNFLPPQDISPIQLARLQGKQRKRASGHRSSPDEDNPAW